MPSTLTSVKRALILISALGISGCGIISFINEHSTKPLPKARVAKSKQNLIVALTSDNHLYISKDGESWSSVKIPNNLKWNNIISANKKLFLVGVNGGISASSDALNWKNLPVSDYRLWVNDLTYTYKLKVYAAVGINGLTVISNGLSNWAINRAAQSTWFTSSTYGDKKLVAVGSLGEVYYTSDEKKWISTYSGVHNWLSNIKFLNNKFYAVGDNGTIIKSSDAINWNTEDSNTHNWLYSVNNLESNIYIVGENSIVLKQKESSDTWNKLVTNLPENHTLRTLDSVNDKLLYVGGENGLIAYSTDGKEWKITKIKTNATIIKIAHLNSPDAKASTEADDDSD